MAQSSLPNPPGSLANTRRRCAGESSAAIREGSGGGRFGTISGLSLPVPALFRRSMPRMALSACPSTAENLRGSASRGVAQPGSASALGAEGRRFESCLPDHIFKHLDTTSQVRFTGVLHGNLGEPLRDGHDNPRPFDIFCPDRSHVFRIPSKDVGDLLIRPTGNHTSRGEPATEVMQGGGRPGPEEAVEKPPERQADRGRQPPRRSAAGSDRHR